MQRHSNSQNGTESDSKADAEIEINFSKEIIGNYVTVFPNPNAGIFTIMLHTNNEKNSINEINLYNSMGSIVYTSRPQEKITPVNLEGLPKGIYLLKITDSYSCSIKKIIIQ